MRARGKGLPVRSKGLLWSLVTAGRGFMERLLIGSITLVVLAGALWQEPRALLAGAVVYGVLRARPDALVAWVAGGALALVAMLLSVLDGPILGAVLGAVYWRLDQWWREEQPVAGPLERRRRADLEVGRRKALTFGVQSLAYAGKAPAAVEKVARRLGAPPLVGKDGGAVLGEVLAGDLDEWVEVHGGRRMLVIPSKEHLVFMGKTRLGKSEAVHRVIEARLRRAPVHQRQIYINAKQPSEGKEPSARLVAVAEDLGLTGRALVRDLSPWDPMRGTPSQVRNRLLAIEEFSDAYYKHVSNLLLGLALDLTAAEGRPLETLPDLVWTLLNGRLEKLAESNPMARELVTMLGRDEVRGAVIRWASNCLTLRGWIGPASVGGWSWEDADVIGVDLPTGTEREAAQMLMRAMLTDLESWIVDKSRRPMVVPPAAPEPTGLAGIIARRRGPAPEPVPEFAPLGVTLEELGALSKDPIIGQRITNLAERCGEAGIEFRVVVQDPNGLGEEREQIATMTNNVTITARQTFGKIAQTLAELAGTEEVAEASTAYGGVVGDRIGQEGSIRVQHSYKVNPQRLRELGLGEVIVFHAGHWAHVAVPMTEAGYRRPVSAHADAVTRGIAAVKAAGPLPVLTDDGVVPIAEIQVMNAANDIIGHVTRDIEKGE